MSPVRTLLVLLAVLGAAACKRAGDPAVIRASGHVEATQVRLSAKVGGRLLELRVREGDAVEAGQDLARLDPVDLELLLRQAQAEAQQARAELQLRLRGARVEDVAEMEAQVKSAQAEAEAARHDQERVQALFERGSGTAKARDDTRARRDATQARAEALGQSLRRLRAGFRVEEQQAARGRLAALEARAAQIEQQLRDTLVVSPRRGLVTSKLVEAGELLSPGTPLLVITDLQDAWLRVYVGEPDLGRIRLGQPAEVVTDDGQTRAGKITFIASQAEFTPRNVQTRDERVKLVYEVKVTLDNRDGLFKPGMPAEARLRAAATAEGAR
jgi:HlyD family secretion protein